MERSLLGNSSRDGPRNSNTEIGNKTRVKDTMKWTTYPRDGKQASGGLLPVPAWMRMRTLWGVVRLQYLL